MSAAPATPPQRHPRRPAAHRRHDRAAARACSTSAAATARCSTISSIPSRSTARGIELSQAGVNACVSHGLSVIQGDADTDLATYPAGAFDYVVLSQTLQATREPHRCWSSWCGSAAGRSSRSPISATGGCAGTCWRSGRMPIDRVPAATAGTTRPTSTSARSWISWRCAPSSASPSSSALAIGGQRPAEPLALAPARQPAGRAGAVPATARASVRRGPASVRPPGRRLRERQHDGRPAARAWRARRGGDRSACPPRSCTTPAKVGTSAGPIRSQAAAVRSSARERVGGMNRARLGLDRREEVVAQQARELGRRIGHGPGRTACGRCATRCRAGWARRSAGGRRSAITRQISRSMSRRCSPHSSPWTSSTRSIDTSGSGSSVSSASATAFGPSGGQRSTPCSAGMTTHTRSGLVADWRR